MTQMSTAEAESVEVREAQLAEMPPQQNNQGTGKLDLLLETTVEVTAVLGSAHMPIGKLLRMGTGSVIPLDREVGRPVDLLLNGVPFARGHLVVVDGRVGIRLTEVETPTEDDDEAAPDG